MEPIPAVRTTASKGSQRGGGREFRESTKEMGSDWKGRHEIFFRDPGFTHPAQNRAELYSGCPPVSPACSGPSLGRLACQSCIIALLHGCAQSLASDSLPPEDCSLPGFSVHEISQARILDWVAISFSRGSSPPRDQTQVSCIAGRFFTI